MKRIGWRDKYFKRKGATQIIVYNNVEPFAKQTSAKSAESACKKKSERVLCRARDSDYFSRRWRRFTLRIVRLERTYGTDGADEQKVKDVIHKSVIQVLC